MSEYCIYPAIGIARVGNSKTAFYVGPEVYRGLPTDLDGTEISPDKLRADDAEKKMARQAARFRIFRTGQDGKPEEVTVETKGVKSIAWTVHLANKKASWYEFQTNSGEMGYASNHPLRNATVKDRQSLMIDAGPRTLVCTLDEEWKKGGWAQKVKHFDAESAPKTYKGTNFPKGTLKPNGDSITTLGELRTDKHGRLLVLGGLGISGTTAKKVSITDYANNDDWYDDTSDGPVSAVIELDDGTVQAVSAHVLVGPPSYAPQIPNLVTLWDTIFDTAVRSGHAPKIFNKEIWNQDYHPNFRTEIGPLLERAFLYTWVTAIPPKPHHFDMAKLGEVPHKGAPDRYIGLRTWIASFLRAPGQENVLISQPLTQDETPHVVGSGGATMMPYLAGDNCLRSDTLTSDYLRLTDTQYFFLKQWADGKFVNHDDDTDLPSQITRGVLENCVGGAFSPGIEMTWISRNSAIYSPTHPFRINNDMVTEGPLSMGFDPAHMEPGDVTRYMAVPWQADFNECSAQPIGERVLWWWPAQRPEFVYLPKEKPDSPECPPIAWVGTDFDQNRDDYVAFADDVDMVIYWDKLGFVWEQGQCKQGKPRYVEVERTLPRPFFPPPVRDEG